MGKSGRVTLSIISTVCGLIWKWANPITGAEVLGAATSAMTTQFDVVRRAASLASGLIPVTIGLTKLAPHGLWRFHGK